MTEQSRLEIVIDSRRGENNVRNLRGELSSLEGTGVRSLSNLRAAALAATGALAAIGVGVGFSSMLSDIRDFSTEMASLRAVSRASAEDMERLENQARLLGATTAFGANQAAQAQRFLAQGGLEVNQILGATPQVMRLAQAGTLGLAEAADLATDVMAQLGLGVNDIERIGDVLVATAQSATTDVSQIGQALSYAGGQASDFGLSLEETVAALGLISSAGIKATRAGTGLVGTLAQLSNVSGPAEETLRSAGLSVAELDIEARGIVPVLETLAAANLSAADRIQIFGRESAAAAGALIRGLDGYREQIQLLGDVEGRAADTARTMTDHLGGAMRGLSSAVSEANLVLGDSGLTGTMRTLIDGATGVVQVFNGMSDEWAENSTRSADFHSNVEAVASGLATLGQVAEATAVAVGVRLTSAIIASTGAKLQNVSASLASARAEAATSAQIQGQAALIARRTAAEKTAAANTATAAAQRAQFARAEAAQDVRRLQATQAQLAADKALEGQRLRAQISATGRQQSIARIAELRRAEVAVTGQLTAATARLTSAEAASASSSRALALARREAAGATAAATAATSRYATAQTAAARAGGAATLAARAGAGALALVGGPLGAAAVAAGSIFYFREELGLVPRAVTPVDDSVQELTESLQGLDDATHNLRITALVGEMAALERQAQAAAERVESLRRWSLESASFGQGQQGDIRGGIAAAEFERDEAQNRVDAIRQTISQTAELREEMRQASEAERELEESFANLGNTVDEVVEKFRPMLDQDIEDILARVGPGATIDQDGQIRDAFGNALPSFQRELEAALGDQVRAFESEQNLMAGLEALTERLTGQIAEGSVGAVETLFDTVRAQVDRVAEATNIEGLVAVMPQLEQAASQAAEALQEVARTQGTDSPSESARGLSAERVSEDGERDGGLPIERISESLIEQNAMLGGIQSDVSGINSLLSGGRTPITLVVQGPNGGGSSDAEVDDNFVKMLSDALSSAASAV